jgi:predicted nucleotidyltransferase
LSEETHAPTLAEVKTKRIEIMRLAARRGCRMVRVIGSVARGEAGPESDVDFLVDLDPGRTRIDQQFLEKELAALLGRKVEVVTESGLPADVREGILREAVFL